jgi:nitroreductase
MEETGDVTDDSEPRQPTADLEEVERRLRMPLEQAIATQRTVRRVRPDPVDDVVLRRCLELAVEAPTGSNSQNWSFLVVRDREVKHALAEQYRRAWRVYGGLGQRLRGSDPQTGRILRSVQWQVDHFEDIPVLVVCCLRGGPHLPFVPMPPIAATSHYGSIYPAVQNLLLAARAVGLGASLITLPLWSSLRARRILGLPVTVDPCCVVPLGWPIGRYGRKSRRPVEAVVHLDRWGQRLWEPPSRPSERVSARSDARSRGGPPPCTPLARRDDVEAQQVVGEQGAGERPALGEVADDEPGGGKRGQELGDLTRPEVGGERPVEGGALADHEVGLGGAAA